MASVTSFTGKVSHFTTTDKDLSFNFS